ncbi:M28 family metallopeptidase [Hasllibacter sp. MH4015]|uniref:M28 family metallopeptidase n=1 Tax=Hasllibacter sp. MH4015 TaxID=2854029 RepID=UPI001CD32332|nr:M20/M25/M40 family metallo-hydrolase [Hasllibacter sp. MH4015]
MMDRRMVLAGAAALAARPVWAQGDPIAALVDQVRPAMLEFVIQTLTAFPTRFTDHPDFPAVEAEMARIMSTEAAPARRQSFDMPSGKTRANIVAGDVMDPRGIILLGAHYDSISEAPLRRAPGANDNATGVAAMLMAYDVLTGAGLDKGVVAVAFAGEEQGFVGSSACARIATAEGWPVEMMINLDMLGWRPPDPATPMIVEYDMGNAVPGNDAAAAQFGRLMAEAAADYTTLTTTHTDIWGSDYMPFEAAGFPAVGLYDGGAESPRNHTTTDIAQALDMWRLHQATQIVVASVARYAGL